MSQNTSDAMSESLPGPMAPTFDLTIPAAVVILGAARSGLAAAHFLQARGYRVSLSDAGQLSHETKVELEAAGLPYEEGGHSEAMLSQARFIIASPGIPVTARPFQIAAAHGIPVISEIELASHFCSSRIVAITGSNGKSTTVSLLEALLEAAGCKAAAGGNIGTPFISLLEQELELIVLEISSFQLETTFSLKPEVAILLNLFENHLDRHHHMQSYFALKARLFQAQDGQDHAVLNAASPWCRQLAPELKGQLHWFGDPPPDGGDQAVTVQNGSILYQGQPLLGVDDLGLHGSHNLENVLAALTALAALGIRPEPEVLRSFGGIPHRLESLAILDGRQFINDSKATNYLAAQTALNSFTRPIVLIAGGLDKGGDFQPLAALIGKKVKHTILLGSSAADFTQRLSQTGYNQSTVVADMQTAVELAYRLSAPGDIILLSPATASYDLYRNFEERGDDFRRHVAALISKTE
ncbi:MAG: UDP-N-acetylmuramoyl-L-alanine--D-glutamate ligase [Candidatus Sericytochromatia bacterium]